MDLEENQSANDPQTDAKIARERKREEGKERLLKNMLTNRYETLYTRVASILNKYIDARNNDVELQLQYWKEYEGYTGGAISPDEMKKYTRLTSLTRARAKIQNEFGLFRAERVVEENRQELAGEQRKKAKSTKPVSNPLVFIYADESGKTGGEPYLLVGSVWFNDFQRHHEVQQELRAWLAATREHVEQDGGRFPKEFHFTEMKKQQLDLYKRFFDKVMGISDMVSFKAVAVKKSQMQFKTLEQSIYSLYYQLAHLGMEHEIQTGRLSLPRSICYYKDADKGSDKLHLEETRQLLRERFNIHYKDDLRLETMDGMLSQAIIAVQVADLITGSISRRLNSPNGNNHKDDFANYVLERLNVDYIKHEVSEFDNGKTSVNIETKEEQDMFYVHIFE